MTDLLTDPEPKERTEISGARATDLVVRIAIVCAAALAAGFDAPTAVATVLVALAAVVAVLPLVRRRELGWEDSLLVGVAGLFLVAVPLGLVLNLLPSGITGLSWALGLEAVGVAAVLWDWSRSEGTMLDGLPLPSRRSVLRTVPWYLAALALVIVAFGVSVHATDVATRPPAQLAVTDRTDGVATVDITGGPDRERYSLTVRQGALTAPTRSFDLAAGEQVSYRVAVATGAPTTVTLRDSDGTELRSLRLQPGSASVR